MKCFFDIQRWMDFQSARSPQMKATSLDFLFPSALCWTDSHKKRQTLLDTWRERKVLGNRIAALISTGATLPHPVQRWLVRVFGKMVIDSYPSWCQGYYLSSCTKSRQVWGTKIWHYGIPLTFVDLQMQAWSPQDMVSEGCKNWPFPSIQWEFQDPKMEVLYHIRPYFVRMFP